MFAFATYRNGTNSSKGNVTASNEPNPIPFGFFFVGSILLCVISIYSTQTSKKHGHTRGDASSWQSYYRKNDKKKKNSRQAPTKLLHEKTLYIYYEVALYFDA